MGAIASQLTSLTIVYSTVYSDADQRKHQSSASLAFVWGIHRDRWIPLTNGQLRGNYFHWMTSSWVKLFPFTTDDWPLKFQMNVTVINVTSTMMASPNGNVYRVTSPLCGESTGHRWISLKRPVTRSFGVFLISAWTNVWANNRDAGNLRRHGPHYDVTVMHDVKARRWMSRFDNF